MIKQTGEFVHLEHVAQLKTGDIVQGRSSGEVYVVTGQYGDRATAVKSVDITHAPEWVVWRPVKPKPEQT